MISTTRFRVNMALTFAATGIIVALAGKRGICLLGEHVSRVNLFT